MKKKRKKYLTGYTDSSWALTMEEENYMELARVEHDEIFKKRDYGIRTKVRITIEEI